LEPGAVPKVSVNDEALFSVRMPAPGPVAAGEAIPIKADAVSGLRPITVDADAAWVAFALLGDHVIVAFDFRRDRATALALLDRADASCARLTPRWPAGMSIPRSRPAGQPPSWASWHRCLSSAVPSAEPPGT
jgi:hypothetical protein